MSNLHFLTCFVWKDVPVSLNGSRNSEFPQEHSQQADRAEIRLSGLAPK